MKNLQILKSYNDKGWVKVEKFCKVKEIKLLKKKINDFLKRNHKNYSGRDINYTGNKINWRKINSFHKLDDCGFINRFSQKKEIKNLVKKLISTKKVKLRASELFAKPKKNGLDVPVHQDNFYWCIKDSKALTMWIALEKTNSKNGSIFYYNGSQKIGLLEHKPSFKKGSSQMIKSFKKLKKCKISQPSLNPGDCIIHHCEVVHGSNKNVSNMSRKGFTFQFVDYFSKLDLKRKRKYEKSLFKQISSRKN